jgi:hypothetical protein
MASKLGVLLDLNLVRADKWDMFVRTRLKINPSKPLRDTLPLGLPNGTTVTTLVHYE